MLNSKSSDRSRMAGTLMQQPHVDLSATGDKPAQLQTESRRGLRWGLRIAAAVAAGIVIWLFASRIWSGETKQVKNQGGQAPGSEGLTRVDVIHPKAGGIERVTVQPGTVEPFESADLYAKVSGFLLETKDIGARVQKGDVLARISVPEFEKQVQKDAASVENAKAKIRQMESKLVAAKAEAKAAEQMIVQAKIEAKSKTAYQEFRRKQLERIRGLYKETAVEAKLVDEEMDRYQAAFEAENAAKEAVTTWQLRADAAKAKIGQAEADIDEAKAELLVDEAELQKANVFLAYTVIKSPYDGVVTKRNFNRGDFIRSADAGGDRFPIVAVDRTDLMRIVVQVPDRDVPYLDAGDPATVEIDALPGLRMKGVVARTADAEDPQTRTMRAEIDMPNTSGKFRRAMYGRVTIVLQPGSATAVRIPSSALISKGDDGKGSVRIVRDGLVHRTPVEVGSDNGEEVEILRGLSTADSVVVHANGLLEDGAKVLESSTAPISSH